MDRLTKLAENGLLLLYMEKYEGLPAYVTAGNPYYSAIKKLYEYEDLNLTPTQLQEIDKLYAEKCKEVVELNKRIYSLKNEIDELQSNIVTLNYEISDWKAKSTMNTTPLERTVSKLQEAKIIELKENIERLSDVNGNLVRTNYSLNGKIDSLKTDLKAKVCHGCQFENVEKVAKENLLLKQRIEELEFGCEMSEKINNDTEKYNQDICDKLMKLKEENEQLKVKSDQITNPSCRCNECKYFSIDGCAENTMYCNLHGCYISGVNGYCHRCEKALAETESENE